ncbi:MAG TPA: ATP-binding protein [Opitutaceae bacterium]|nr:ATP-binding protein [Opitutaceae bacterium]
MPDPTLLRFRIGYLLATLACVLVPRLSAETTVNSLVEFWNLTAEQREQPITFRLECYVTYYDDEWNNLWIQNGEFPTYVNPGTRPLPIKSGERIVAFGKLPNAHELTFAGAIFQTVGTGSPTPLPIENNIDNLNEFTGRLVTVDALVDRTAPPVVGHQLYELSVEGRRVLVWLRLAQGDAAPDLHNARIRVTGVYSPTLDPSGALALLTLLVPSSSHIVRLSSLDEDPRFEIARTPIDRLPDCPPHMLVRVAGIAVGREPAVSLQIRDETGQVELRNTQTLPCPIGSAVEAVGYPRIAGTNWRLVNPTYRLVRGERTPAPELDPGQPLRLAAQIAELSPEAAAAARPVRINGVVTWAHPDASFFFVQDASGGVCVFRDHTQARLRLPGRLVEVTGVTRMGPFSPAVNAADIVKTGDTTLPTPEIVSLDQAMTGAKESRYIALHGYVRELQRQPPWTRLVVATPSGDFHATIAANEEIGPVLDSVVRLRGVCSATINEQGQLGSINLWLPDAASIQITEPALPDPFARPFRLIEKLGRYGSVETDTNRIRVVGLVAHHDPGESLGLLEGGAPLLVLARDPTPLTPGDRIEAVGFLGHQGRRLALREAVFRKIGADKLPPARELVTNEWARPAHIGQIVSIEGVLISTADAGGRTRLTIQSGNTLAEAYLRGPKTWSVGSRLRLTGVHDLQYDAAGRPSLPRLNLRSNDDVVVLHRPPWFTRGRVLIMTVALALSAFLIGLWGVALRRRVQQQTDQIRRQLERETHLERELQRTSRLEALGLLAGGIAHDFNNLLTVVMGNLSLLRDTPKLDDDALSCLDQAEKAVGRSRDLTMQLLTFAKGGNPIRTAVPLAEVVQEATRFALHGSTVSPLFQIAPDVWPAEVDKGQISQVVQNIVINAVQAMPQGGRIDLALANEMIPAGHPILAAGRYVRLTIADTGPGIAAEALPKIFDPYFTTKKSGHGIGLATVHSIVKKHQGHVTVSSKLGEGTSFQIWLPAAQTAAQKPAEPAAPAMKTVLSGRALVLDDEESIRRLSAAMLTRLGLEPTAVADGTEAIRAYATAREEGRPFAVVILDLTIPGGLGGEDTLRELLKIDPAVCAVVSSGYSNNPVLSDHRAYGFKGMVSKPYELADLALVLEQLLGARETT